MKLFKYYGLLMLLAYSSLHAETHNPVTDFPTELENPYLPLFEQRRPFVGEFTFQPAPAPLVTSTVNFTLEVTEPRSMPDSIDTWVIRLFWEPKQVRLIGDTVFYWTGSHEVGDQFQSSFDIVPLTSGRTEIVIQADGGEGGGLTLQWILDEDGQLRFLGKLEDNFLRNFKLYGVTFFNDDSVHLQNNHRFPGPGALLYDVVIKPPFRIGDTSTVRYRLTAIRDLPEGAYSQFVYTHCDLVGYPPIISGPLDSGQSYVTEVKLVPLPVANVHVILYDIDPVGAGSSRVAPIHVLFGGDGSAKYISDGSLHGVSRAEWSRNLPVADHDRSSVFYIDPDGTFRQAGRPDQRLPDK